MKTERLRMPVAVHLLLTRGDEVLLLRRFNTGYEDGNFSVPAGHLDGRETVIEAMIREAREEVGITLDAPDVRVVQVMHRFAEEERIDYFLVADRWSGEIAINEPDKCDALEWFPVNSLPENTVPYVAAGIRYWREGASFSTFGREK
ncbi:MAG TPA: NUDIX domain-containing protein [Thermomicrobiales bacterium]|nr:NUDIX domain-containing protein [Thermomicrobiales bacterium]